MDKTDLMSRRIEIPVEVGGGLDLHQLASGTGIITQGEDADTRIQLIMLADLKRQPCLPPSRPSQEWTTAPIQLDDNSHQPLTEKTDRS